jgi:futalosine hydrolase
VRILVVAATAAEIGPVTDGLRREGDRDPRTTSYTGEGHNIDVLVTGVGMVATATWCAHALGRDRYDVALNLGVCGSFDRALALGSVVHVVSDRLAELGAEDDEAFLSIHEMRLLDENEPPFVNGRLLNQAPPVSATLASLPAVNGITVNTVHGRDRSIAAVTARLAPQVESMEGAAFMYACLVHGQRFAQVRAVSNLVQRRNREAWKLAEAVVSLGATALRMLNEL